MFPTSIPGYNSISDLRRAGVVTTLKASVDFAWLRFLARYAGSSRSSSGFDQLDQVTRDGLVDERHMNAIILRTLATPTKIAFRCRGSHWVTQGVNHVHIRDASWGAQFDATGPRGPKDGHGLPHANARLVPWWCPMVWRMPPSQLRESRLATDGPTNRDLIDIWPRSAEEAYNNYMHSCASTECPSKDLVLLYIVPNFGCTITGQCQGNQDGDASGYAWDWQDPCLTHVWLSAPQPCWYW